MAENSSVLIERKQVMNYILTGVSPFHGGATSLRYGMRYAISRAIDVVDVTLCRFMQDLK